MWKKFLAVMAITGLLTSQTALAGGVGDEDPDQVEPLVTGYDLDVDTINPSEGETATLTVKVAKDSTATGRLMDSATGITYAVVFQNEAMTADTEYTYEIDGLLQGNPLADGDYMIRTVASAVDGSEGGIVNTTLTITSTPEGFKISSLQASTSVVDPTTTIDSVTYTFSVNEEAAVAAVIKDEDNATVKTFNDLSNVTSGTFVWDARDDDGDLVDAGDYTFVLEAFAEGKGNSDTKSLTTEVKYDGVADSDLITNVEVSPNPWDPSEEELDIDFELEEDVKDFSLHAKLVGENDDVELWEDEDMDADDYTLEWDGLDDDDDYIEEGTWALVFEADDDKVTYYVEVEYDKPEVMDDMFVTKESFDNTIGEFTYVVFRVDADAVVTVEVMDGNKEIVTLMDEEEVSDNDWYAVKWDGMDDDGDEADEDTYEFRVTAMNTANDDIESVSEISVVVEEDEVSTGESNVTNDSIFPVIVSKNTEDTVEIDFTIDEEAEVTIEIFKGNKSSNPEVVLLDDQTLKAGSYTFSWDGRDEDGKKLDKNEKYSYRVTSRVDGKNSKTDKERGFFAIGEAGTTGGEPTPTPTPTPDPTEGCGFWDVTTNSNYCEAILWAKEAGVFGGYTDGSFRQYDFINRAEALKVIVEAFDVPVLPDDYTNLGFTDVITGSWYMKYLRTGKFYGLVAGYGGTTLVQPEEEINRVELLKFTLEAAETVNGYKVPVCNVKYYSDAEGDWYQDYVCLAHDYDLYNTYSGYFYPGNKVMRGEVALLLYRLSQAGLL